MKFMKMLTIVMIIASVSVIHGMQKQQKQEEQSLAERVSKLEEMVEILKKVVLDQTMTIKFLHDREFKENAEKKDGLVATIAMLQEAKKLNGNG
jgi:predicted translin family RNA/ssDNA-binding protein